jgi:hypothetical protein
MYQKNKNLQPYLEEKMQSNNDRIDKEVEVKCCTQIQVQIYNFKLGPDDV